MSPDCTPATLSDPTKCLPVHPERRSAAAARAAAGTCTLCPGQTMLPADCTGATCPNDEQPCTNGACPMDTYCSNGCCIGAIL